MVKPLVNIQNYFKNKSVKLSDSYVAIFNGSESYSCCGFTIPKVVEWTTEEYSFGNVTQKFLIPKLDMIPELKIELYESYDKSSKDNSQILKRKNQLWNQKSNGQNVGNAFYSDQDFSTDGYTTLKGIYGRYIDGELQWNNYDYKTLEIQILNNTLSKVVYKYYFEDLRLTTAESYDLSYQDESVTKWTLGFVFKSMKKGVF